MADEVYLSIEEVAKRLGVEEKTVEKYVRQGRLKAVKNPVSGSVVGIRESDLQEFLTGKPVEPKDETKQSGEVPELAEAKKQTTLEEEHTKQAKFQNDQHRAKIEMDLRQKNYDSIEAGIKDAEAKKEEALKILEDVNLERESVKLELEAVMRERQKAVSALAVAKEREKLVNKKYAEMIVKEESQKAFVNKYDDWRKKLQEYVDYHNDHIQPCVKALTSISKTIYSWAEILNDHTGYDFMRLYNYIGTKMAEIDKYVDYEPSELQQIEKEDNLETANGKSNEMLDEVME